MIPDEPKALFRYRHLQGKHREWTKKIITDSLIYFASPLSFNDPFDCKVHYQSSLSPKQLRLRYTEIMKRKQPHLNRKSRRGKAAKDLASLSPAKFISQMERGMQDTANNIGVLSLSATNCNILLWSHYAAGHSGLCFKFQISGNNSFLEFTQPVTYSEEYPKIDILNSSPDEQVQAFLRTKAIDWKYEEEWRIIDVRKGPGYKTVPREMLSEIIFGAKINQKDKEEVIEWVENSKSPIQLSQATISKDQYSIKIEPFKP